MDYRELEYVSRLHFLLEILSGDGVGGCTVVVEAPNPLGDLPVAAGISGVFVRSIVSGVQARCCSVP